MGQQIKNWTVSSGEAALSGELRNALGVSHRQAKGLIDAGCVRVNDELATSHGKRVKDGDAITVNFDPDTSYHELPKARKSADSEIKILWEDKHLVFVEKPAGMLSVPTEMSDESSLADALVEQYRKRGIKKQRIYIAHRIDRYTTGVIVFAKTPESIDGLKELFHEHRINRIYKAILVGELPENAGALHDKLIERTRKMKMAVVARRTGAALPEGAKPAMTHYRVIERLPGHTVVELKLETGRRNQIRVQFAERGFPLLGDHIYGSVSPIIDRQALHAELLGLRHPVTDENITVQAAIPEDFEDALKKLRALRRVERAKAGIKGEDGIFKPRETKEHKENRIAKSKAYFEEKTQEEGERTEWGDHPRDRARRSERNDRRGGRRDEDAAPAKPRPRIHSQEDEKKAFGAPRKAAGARRTGRDADFASPARRSGFRSGPDDAPRKPSRDGSSRAGRTFDGEKPRRRSDESSENKGPRKEYARRGRDERDAGRGYPESRERRPGYGRAGQEPKGQTKRWTGRDSEADRPKRNSFARPAPNKARPGAKRAGRPPRRKD